MQEEQVTADNYDEETFEPIGSTHSQVEPEYQRETAEGETEESVNTDQPEVKPEDKSVAHFQRVAQEKHDLAMQKEQLLKEKDAELQKLSQRLNEIEQKFQPKQVEEELKPPQPPDPDEPLDEIRYLKELREYDNKVNEKRWSIVEAERQQIKQQREMQEHRRGYLSQFMNVGANADEASKVYDFGFSEVSTNPELMLKFYRFVNSGKSQPTNKTNSINAPLPAGVVAGESENQSFDPNRAFNEDMEKRASRGRWL